MSPREPDTISFHDQVIFRDNFLELIIYRNYLLEKLLLFFNPRRLIIRKYVRFSRDKRYVLMNIKYPLSLIMEIEIFS